MDTFTRAGHENVKFFVGPEVEQTPAFSKKTLFVVGLQDTALVEKLARENKTQHIFLSANRSFDSVELKNGVYMVGDTLASDWEKQIHYLLDTGFMVSLDYPAHKHVDVLRILNPGIWQSRNFVPVLSVAVPNVSTSSVNLTIKIDDSNFKETNPGVWCMHHSEVTDSNRFTSWNEYGDDVIINVEDDKPTPVPPYTPQPQVSTEVRSMRKQIKPEDLDAAIDQQLDFGKGNLQDTASAFVGSLAALAAAKGESESGAEMNPQDLGLDPDAPSMLKPEVAEVLSHSATTPVVNAADAYADGAKEDPLGKTATKKSKAAK
jgi:hypothetical protein